MGLQEGIVAGAALQAGPSRGSSQHVYPSPLRVPVGVIMGRQNFWLAAVVGAIVMFIFFFLPFIGPLVGGFVAGLIARGTPKNGAKAGLAAGVIGAVLAALVFLVGPWNMGIFQYARTGVLSTFGMEILLLVMGLYHALFGLVGGAVGAALVKGT
jgi:hypothetical protein